MTSEMYYEITYPFPNFNGSTVEAVALIEYGDGYVISSHTLQCNFIIHAGIFKLNHISKMSPYIVKLCSKILSTMSSH